MVNGWLPDEDELGAGEVSEWFRTKLERLAKAGERCFSIEGEKGVRFVAWVGGEPVQSADEMEMEEGSIDEGCQGRRAQETTALNELNWDVTEGIHGESMREVLGAVNIEPSVEMTASGAQAAKEADTWNGSETETVRGNPILARPQKKKKLWGPAIEGSEEPGFDSVSKENNRQFRLLPIDDLSLPVWLDSEEAGGNSNSGRGALHTRRKADGHNPRAALPAFKKPAQKGLAVKGMGRGGDDVAAPEREAVTRPTGSFLRGVCALANARAELKAEALRRMESRRGNQFSEGGFDARAALALLAAVERAALPSLARNTASGDFEVARTADGVAKTQMPWGWHDAVTDEVGYKTVNIRRASQDIRTGSGEVYKSI